MQRLSAPSCPSHSSGSGSPSSSRLDFGEQSAAVGRERGHVPRPTPWSLVDLTFLSRGASAPQFSLTADGFQIFCLSFVGKWSTELWFGSSHGKSTLPLAGDVRADLGPPFQDRGGGAEGAPLERAWQAPRGGGRMAAAPSCSPGWTGPSSGPMRRGRGRWSQMSSLPLPAGRGELSPSPCVEPGAWGWAPRLWNPCLGHTPPLPPSGLASSSEGASALPASGWGPNQGAGSCSPRDPYRSSLELSRGAWDSRSLFPHPTPALASGGPPTRTFSAAGKCNCSWDSSALRDSLQNQSDHHPICQDGAPTALGFASSRAPGSCGRDEFVDKSPGEKLPCHPHCPGPGVLPPPGPPPSKLGLRQGGLLCVPVG